MREILFRGKRTDNGEWVYEDLWCNPYGKKVVCITSPINAQGTTGGNEVDPETVGQFIGLYDKNSKKIFEGDIVRLIDEHNEIEWTAVVAFGNPNCEYNWGWQLKAIGKFDGNKDILLWVDMEDFGVYCEVIGNIHDKKLEDFENGC